MKINRGKIHILLSANGTVSENIGKNVFTSETKNELLGIILDLKLTFEDLKKNPAKKKNVRKLNTFARIAPYMCFVYCHLVWMFHNRRVKNKINYLHD